MKTLLITAAAFTLAAPALAEPVVGEAAPAFTGTDTYGNEVSLSDFAGQKVILEWSNDGCPYVQRHYKGDMQAMQQDAAQQDIAWLTIISSAPGKQGHVTPDQANAITAGEMEDRPQAYPAAVILDPEGDIGRMYEAKTSPHMFLIDEAGVLQYDGAIDDSPRGPADEADNHVEAALAALRKGEPVDPAQTTPYGCSVKYADS
ncbi:MAG: redoxin domain-containing protein [Euryhalocaulis sp.]|uniref:redoxin domain-containing protein n=1 Tax=Euryhalocaulis sp. TaxID=2744307 RepID=UPI0017BA6501|nr:redoxin domain-containing protein [Euryhalocaulis sp.]MBA4801168.1 redoxin domain-containing protein [Euryhalocaulis sp.]